MNALAPATSSRGTLAYGSRADVPYGCGNVCAQAVLAATDPRTGIPAYAVRIANNSQHALRAVVRFGNRTRTPSSELDVAPFSIVESLVPHGALTRPDDRAIVEIRGTNLAFTIDAPPALSRGNAFARRAASTVGIVAVAGSLALAAATFAVQHATHATPAALVHSSAPTAAVAKPAAPIAPPANVLRVGASRVIAGSTLRIAYTPNARGDVWLLDQHGRIWGHDKTNARGHSSLAIPENAAGRDLRVVVGEPASTGELRQVASTIAILPDASNLAPQNQTAPKSDVTVSPTSVNAGANIAIRFKPRHGEALVSITDQGGSIVDQSDVPADTPRALLRAPATGAPATYDVVVTITNGNAQDQSIIPIVVTP